MSPEGTGMSISSGAALCIRESFESYNTDFAAITARAKPRFEGREWKEVLNDAEERICLYHQYLNTIEAGLSALMKEHAHDYQVWEAIKAEYLAFYQDAYEADLALVYFYSVMRRIFIRTGASIEYS